MWGSPSMNINTELQTSRPLSQPMDLLEAWKATLALVPTRPSACLELRDEEEWGGGQAGDSSAQGLVLTTSSVPSFQRSAVWSHLVHFY